MDAAPRRARSLSQRHACPWSTARGLPHAPRVRARLSQLQAAAEPHLPTGTGLSRRSTARPLPDVGSAAEVLHADLGQYSRSRRRHRGISRSRLRGSADAGRRARRWTLGRPLIVHDAALSSGCCRDVAIAGRFVAWSDRNDVVVYDRLARHLAYRARIGPEAGIGIDLGFGLQRDGKVAVSYRLVEVARTGPTTIAWLSPSAPRLHLLRLHASDTRIRIADDRIAAERFLSPSRSALVVADLAGRARPVTSFAPPVRLRGRFDFDGRQIAWASDRVTSTRVDCPHLDRNGRASNAKLVSRRSGSAPLAEARGASLHDCDSTTSPGHRYRRPPSAMIRSVASHRYRIQRAISTSSKYSPARLPVRRFT